MIVYRSFYDAICLATDAPVLARCRRRQPRLRFVQVLLDLVGQTLEAFGTGAVFVSSPHLVVRIDSSAFEPPSSLGLGGAYRNRRLAVAGSRLA